jgi:aromatic ring hydroxylase
MFGRSPDFKSIFTTVFASAADELGHKTRVKLFRLAIEAAAPLFAGRAQLYEGYCSRELARLSGTLYGLYDKDTQIDPIIAMLDDVKARER